MPSILDTGQKLAVDAALEQVRAEKPNAFTVGGYTDGKTAVASVTYDRKWSNGWGATAYAKAWWNDASVTPHPKLGGEAGVEARKTF